MRGLILAVAAACSPKQVVSSPSPAPPPADARVATVDAATKSFSLPAFPRIEAPPAGAIHVLAVTPDGSAAVTADELGGVRLWPALDGSAEPVIVDLPPPSHLAITALGAQYLVAMLDDAGGAIVAQLDRDGQVVHHTPIEPTGGPRFIGVVALDEFLLWSDHALLAIDIDGTVINTLTSRRVLEVATTTGFAFGVVEEDGKLQTRRIGTAPLSWGEVIAGATGLVGIAAGGDGNRLAGITGGRAVVLDLEANRQLANAPAPTGSVLGFAGDRLAIAGPNGSLAWVGGAKLAARKDAAPALLASGGTRVISARGGDLVIASPAKIEYLGYGLTDAVPHAAGGELLVGNDDRWAFLDAKLDVVGKPRLKLPKGQLEGLAKLAGDDWLLVAQTPKRSDIYVANLASGALTKVHTRKTITFAATSPGSDLVTFGNGSLDDSEVFRHANGSLVRVAMPHDSGLGMLQPVAPTLANGAQLVRVSYATGTDDAHLRWIHDVDHPEAGAVDLDIKRYATPAIDAAGRVFVTTHSGGGHPDDLAIYRDGKLVQDGLDFVEELAPAPASGRFAMVGLEKLSMHAADGARQWTTPVPNRPRPIWVDEHHLVAGAWPGLTAIDADTGVIGRTRCGWRFGISATPNPAPTAIATACTRLAETRDDHVEAPGDVAFRKAMRALAGGGAPPASGSMTRGAGTGAIAEWGVAPINGEMRRFAVIVLSGGDAMDTVVAYVVEVSPGAYTEAAFHGWGFVQPGYSGLVADPAWTVGATASAAREDRWGNRIATYRDNAFAFETRWIHMSGEEFRFTLRGDTFVVASWDWTERERDHARMHSTGERKLYSKTGLCGAACPKLAGHKTHATKIRVVGPTSDIDALTVTPP